MIYGKTISNLLDEKGMGYINLPYVPKQKIINKKFKDDGEFIAEAF